PVEEPQQRREDRRGVPLRGRTRGRVEVSANGAGILARPVQTHKPQRTDMDPKTIDAYETGPAKLRAATAGLTREQLTARPGPGDWSILEVVVHIADSDAISIDRMKRMLSEDNPP